ncbi:MAG: SHOCT domain-containing protein [Anaerolineales bacterium]|nr:SHOCT domain-containing protein [Anaerolineales bacterium]
MKNLRWIFIISAIIAVASIGGGIYGAIQETDWSVVREMNIPRMLETGEFLAIPIMIIALGFVLTTLWHFYRVISPPQIKNGVTAPAKVLKVWDTGTTINDDPQIGMLLEVTPSMGTAFEAEAKTIVSRLNAALIQPGITAKVVYDPQKPKRIQVMEIHVKNPAESNAVGRMEELEQLRSRHLISEEEYQEKRKQILHNL